MVRLPQVREPHVDLLANAVLGVLVHAASICQPHGDRQQPGTHLIGHRGCDAGRSGPGRELAARPSRRRCHPEFQLKLADGNAQVLGDRGPTDPQDLGDLFGGLVAWVVQDDYLPLAAGQGVECVHHSRDLGSFFERHAWWHRDLHWALPFPGTAAPVAVGDRGQLARHDFDRLLPGRRHPLPFLIHLDVGLDYSLFGQLPVTTQQDRPRQQSVNGALKLLQFQMGLIMIKPVGQREQRPAHGAADLDLPQQMIGKLLRQHRRRYL